MYPFFFSFFYISLIASNSIRSSSFRESIEIFLFAPSPSMATIRVHAKLNDESVMRVERKTRWRGGGRRERLPFIKLKTDRSIHTERAHRGKGKARRRKKTRLGWSRWMNWLRSNEEGEEEGGGGNTCNRALKYGHLPMAPGLITSVFSEAGPGTVMY